MPVSVAKANNMIKHIHINVVRIKHENIAFKALRGGAGRLPRVLPTLRLCFLSAQVFAANARIAVTDVHVEVYFAIIFKRKFKI